VAKQRSQATCSWNGVIFIDNRCEDVNKEVGWVHKRIPTTYSGARRDLEETSGVTGYLSKTSRDIKYDEIKPKQENKGGRSSASSSSASFLGFFLGAADTSSLDQGGEMR
jgi:hypothetical protein